MVYILTFLSQLHVTIENKLWYDGMKMVPGDSGGVAESDEPMNTKTSDIRRTEINEGAKEGEKHAFVPPSSFVGQIRSESCVKGQ